MRRLTVVCGIVLVLAIAGQWATMAQQDSGTPDSGCSPAANCTISVGDSSNGGPTVITGNSDSSSAVGDNGDNNVTQVNGNGSAGQAGAPGSSGGNGRSFGNQDGGNTGSGDTSSGDQGGTADTSGTGGTSGTGDVSDPVTGNGSSDNAAAGTAAPESVAPGSDALAANTATGGQTGASGQVFGSAVVAAASGTPAACPADLAENKGIVQLWFNVWGTGNVAEFDSLLVPNYVHHWGQGSDTTGVAAFKQRVEEFRTAFPDLSLTVDQVFGEGDAVAVRWTAHGTHQGTFRGIAPTGRSVTWTGINVFRLDCGRVAETWNETDDWGLLQQLGAVPPIGTPAP